MSRYERSETLGTIEYSGRATVYVDTPVLVYSVEKCDEFAEKLVPLWTALRSGRINVVTSSLTLLEVLVVPLKNRDEALVKNYRAVLENSDLALLQITAETMLEAARLRAEVNIKTPDAIHAASALVTGCDIFLTNDRGFSRITALNVSILSEVN